MDPHERRESAGCRQAILFGFLDATKADIAVGEDTFVLSVEKNLQQRKVRCEKVRGLRGFDFQQIAINVPNQHFGGVERHFSLPGLEPSFFG